MVAIGLVFWWPVLSDAPRSVPTLGRIAYVFAAFVGSAFLGLALTFAPPLYSYYESLPVRLWGISAAKDQNLGGVLMTSEQALVLFAAIAWLLVRLFREEDVLYFVAITRPPPMRQVATSLVVVRPPRVLDSGCSTVVGGPNFSVSAVTTIEYW